MNKNSFENNILYTLLFHDLFTPLNTLSQLSQITLDNFDDYNREELELVIKAFNQSTVNLKYFLDNMFELLLLDNNSIFNLEDCNLNEIINEIINLFQLNLKQKNITIINKINQNIIIKADKITLMSVLKNIITNAIKFSYENSTIELNVKEKENKVIIEIKDYGIGMNNETLNNLFFNKVTSINGTKSEKGHGIGLLLCKKFIEQNNGNIWVESNFGVGTTFSIEINKINN